MNTLHPEVTAAFDVPSAPARPDELYGSPEQIAVMRRAAHLWELVKDDPRFCTYGRMVSTAGDQEGLYGRLAALARLQGVVSAQFFPAVLYDELRENLEPLGFGVARWEQHWGREGAWRKSRDWLDRHDLPAELTVRQVTPDTSPSTVAAIAALQIGAGVMPVPGAVMRGFGPRGLCLYAEAEDGSIAAAGVSFLCFHPESRFAREAFWGGLATGPAWRGRRVAPTLGARLIVEMHDRFGAEGFSTGVKADNPSSMAMCAKVGVEPSQFLFTGVSDPAITGTAPVTR